MPSARKVNRTIYRLKIKKAKYGNVKKWNSKKMKKPVAEILTRLFHFFVLVLYPLPPVFSSR